jgi:hypothetical protein
MAARSDTEYAEIIHRYIVEHGGQPMATNLVRAARASELQLSLACALVEQESGFRNIFGHDPTIFAGAGKVTRAKYLDYKRQRGHTRMQGVGPVQLTWWEFQDEADRLGGCWQPYNNMFVGFRLLSSLIKRHGRHTGLARYNGSGSAAERYANSVEAKAREWHARLTR